MLVNPQTAFQRIQQRKRPQEASIQLEYLRDLKKYYERWLVAEKNKVWIVNGEQPIDQVEQEYLKILKQIDKSLVKERERNTPV